MFSHVTVQTKLNAKTRGFNLDVATNLKVAIIFPNVSYTRFYCGDCIIFDVPMTKFEHLYFRIKSNLSLSLSCCWHHAWAIAACSSAPASVDVVLCLRRRKGVVRSCWSGYVTGPSFGHYCSK